ncbi:MAG TPA: M20 family peptidase [Gemmatimonadales bacterium]
MSGGKGRMAAKVLLLSVPLAALWLVAQELADPPGQGGSTTAPAPAPVISPGAAERLGGSIRLRTVSHADPAAIDASSFAALHDYLESSFPQAHAALRRESVGMHSLLYTWQGSDTTLRPVLLAAHLDVVPVEPGTESQWQEAPFGGTLADGFVWGRGAIDNKSAVLGTLEAVEMLLSEGFRPKRTIHLAFGHDEEVGGRAGAREIAALLSRRGVRLELVLDEGGVIGDGIMPGIGGPLALVGIAEKGFVSAELSAEAPGGHSSLPPRQSAIGIVSAAVARLEAHPLPARVEGATAQLFRALSPQLPFVQRAVFRNLWLTEPLVVRKLEASPTTNAMVRTTTAVTVFEGGTKENILPTHARAVVNFRILPGDSVEGVLQHVRRVIGDQRVAVRRAATFTAEPSAVSSTASEGYRLLARSIREVDPAITVAPYLVVVATDARYYADLSDDVYRFLPVRLGPDDLPRVHGIDERLGVEDYERAIRFYRQFMLNIAAR